MCRFLVILLCDGNKPCVLELDAASDNFDAENLSHFELNVREKFPDGALC